MFASPSERLHSDELSEFIVAQPEGPTVSTRGAIVTTRVHCAAGEVPKCTYMYLYNHARRGLPHLRHVLSRHTTNATLCLVPSPGLPQTLAGRLGAKTTQRSSTHFLHFCSSRSLRWLSVTLSVAGTASCSACGAVRKHALRLSSSLPNSRALCKSLFPVKVKVRIELFCAIRYPGCFADWPSLCVSLCASLCAFLCVSLCACRWFLLSLVLFRVVVARRSVR